MIAGDEVTPVLLRRLIRSGYLALDLCDFPARTRLWPLLPDDVCTEILAATASGWLRRFTDNPNTSVTFEPEMILREAILQGPIAEAWRRQTNISASTMVAFLQRFPDYSDGEEMLTDWVGKHHRPNPLDAAAIGGFIRERRWRKAASEVASQSQNGHEDWDIATEECSELMGVLQKVLRAFRKQKSIMAADWWAAWLDVTADLYSTGVRDQNIWTRAAGDLSRIDVNRDGYTQWNDALSLLRRGGGGKITIEGLLHQMRKDWENHKHLEVIEKAWLKKRVKTDGA